MTSIYPFLKIVSNSGDKILKDESIINYGDCSVAVHSLCVMLLKMSRVGGQLLRKVGNTWVFARL